MRLSNGTCPECDQKDTLTRVVGRLPVCRACDWTGWNTVTLNDLDWYRSESADATHDDQEVDLAFGNPGGASWAYVAKGYPNGWTWGVMDRWLYDDATQLASGEAKTQTEAKLAVHRWIESQLALDKTGQGA